MSVSLDRRVKKITITNFQSHPYSVYNLTNGLNIVTGSSDNGKTACARAYAWVVNCETSSDVTTVGEKKCSVEIEFFNGDIIRRVKQKDSNLIEFKRACDIEFTSYKAFGFEYPKVVIDFLGMPKTVKELGPLYYSSQLNKSFLIDISSTSLPNVISSLIGVDDLESASKYLSSRVKDKDKEINTVKTNIDKYNFELEEFIDLENQKKVFTEANKLLEDINSLEEEISNAQNIQNKYNDLVSEGKRIKKEITASTKVVDALAENIDVISANFVELNKLIDLKANIQDTFNSISKQKQDIININKTFNDDYKNLIQSIQADNKMISDMKAYSVKIQKAKLDLDEAQNKLKISKEEVKNHKTLLDELISEIKNSGEYCAACEKIGGLSI